LLLVRNLFGSVCDASLILNSAILNSNSSRRNCEQHMARKQVPENLAAALRSILDFVFRVGLVTGLLLLSIPLFQNLSAYAEDSEGEEWTDHLPFDVSGHYRIDYLGRWNQDNDIDGDESDHQLFQYLRIKVDNIVPGKVSLRFSGRLSAELDGNDSDDGFFADIYDTFDHSANGRIYYLYLDIKDPIFKDSDLKLGRMSSYEGETVLFSGAKYEQTINKLRFYVQGGVRGTNYTSPDEDDNIVGAGVDYHVLRYTHVGYDFLTVEDDSLDDDYHSFDISHRIGGLKTYAQFSVLNNNADDLNLYGSYYHAPLDLNLTARYYALFTQRDENTNEFAALIDMDDFDVDDSDTLAVYSPFHLLNLTVYKGLGNRFGTSAGFEVRWIDDSEEKNDLNREYERYFLSVEAWDFIWAGLTASVMFEFWDANGSEDSLSLGIDAEKDLTDKLYVGSGFYFSQYRIRSSFGGTSFSEDIETPVWYGRLKYKLRDDIELAARYEIEDESDLGTTHELRLSCSIDF